MGGTAPPPGGAPDPIAADTSEPAGLARTLARLGLGSSARLLLDMARPVSWLGAQLLWVAQPTFALFGAGVGVARLARTLEDDRALADLAAALAPRPPEPPRPEGHPPRGS